MHQPDRLYNCWGYRSSRSEQPFRRGVEDAYSIPNRRIRPPPQSVQDLTRYCIWLWSSNSGDLRNVEYPFIATTFRSTLVLISSTSFGPICGSNRSIYSIGPYANNKQTKKKPLKKQLHKEVNMSVQWTRFSGDFPGSWHEIIQDGSTLSILGQNISEKTLKNLK